MSLIRQNGTLYDTAISNFVKMTYFNLIPPATHVLIGPWSLTRTGKVQSAPRPFSSSCCTPSRVACVYLSAASRSRALRPQAFWPCYRELELPTSVAMDWGPPFSNATLPTGGAPGRTPPERCGNSSRAFWPPFSARCRTRRPVEPPPSTRAAEQAARFLRSEGFPAPTWAKLLEEDAAAADHTTRPGPGERPGWQ